MTSRLILRGPVKAAALAEDALEHTVRSSWPTVTPAHEDF
jgi:hypothetical protein